MPTDLGGPEAWVAASVGQRPPTEANKRQWLEARLHGHATQKSIGADGE
jgi:hypothetical protein